LGSDASLTTVAGSAGAANTLESEAVRPVTSTVRPAESMKLELPPMSVQVLRLKVK
jgi:hypothetical protein